MTCNNCGKTGLHWDVGSISQKWLPFEENGRQHLCETVGDRRDRNSVYGALDEMTPHELRELCGYASERLMLLEEAH